jgi:tRNA(Arg) A34 adenosine deaminase TadA
VIVHKNKIIGRGHNLTNQFKNGTRHAEMVAIDEILQNNSKEIFKECSVFVTIVLVSKF